MKIRNLTALILSLILAFVNIGSAYGADIADEAEAEYYAAEETEETAETEEAEESGEAEEIPAEETEALETEALETEEAEEAETGETEETPAEEAKTESITLIRAPGHDMSLNIGSTLTYADLADLSVSGEGYSYRALLSDDEKAVYDAIYGKIDYADITYGTIDYIDGPSVDTYMDIVEATLSDIGITIDGEDAAWEAAENIGMAFVFDNPEYTWMSEVAYGVTVTKTIIGDYVTYEISGLDFRFLAASDSETVKSDMSVFDEWKNNVISNASKYTVYYDSLKYAHDALCKQTSYNYNSLNYDFNSEICRYAHCPLGITALTNQVVCEGYAKAYKLICDELDIPCLLLTSDDHMWNIVKMEDGEWYGVDVTWDDSDDSAINYDYFLKGEGVFNSEPEERGEYTNPFGFTLAYNDYEYTTTTTTTTESTTETTTDENYVASPAFTVVGVFGGRNVTFTSNTAGAEIYYSADTYILTTDDTCVVNGETVLFEDFYGTIYARAYYNGMWSDVSRLILKIPVTAAPEITVDGSSVTIASGTPSSFVCYTTDGTEPVVDNDGTAVNGTWIRKNGARVNSGTITVDSGVTVKAIAVRSCFTNSVSASAYVPVGSPAFTVVGAYGGRNVTFSSSTEGAVIYYSSESYVLTTSDTKVSNGETILFEDFYGTIYARAYYNGVWSDVSRLILKIPVVEAPEVTYEGNVVRLVSGTKDSFICYTTDGTDPVVKPDGTVTNGTWIKVNGARTTKGSITVSSGTTVKAISIRNCFTNSSITTCTVS
ncbi:MAG: chitobiase/beta-hexosaminidase C-terminal domain-containing protein [Clostridiales bacterium]|nr:chitobiase/beta-hexosaminidase C-terminal domain-containing protein [Clostridiales bacterium]